MQILDNPIWTSLTTRQAYLAEGDDLARRYPTEVTALAALKQNTPEAFESLARISGSDVVALFCYDPITIPPGWKTIHTSNLVQMVCEAPEFLTVGAEPRIDVLSAADSEETLALTKLTNPGPFGTRTHELGLYLGIHQQGRLAAMAGERQKLPGYTEVSAVCTHPDFQGRGYARILMSAVMEKILERGETPILHVREDNAGAIRVYERLGFQTRAVFPFFVLRNEQAETQAG
ncbi:MAG TPA: GNAT family N-acetyltransferase [Candidatus Acidoferrales bacterium]